MSFNIILINREAPVGHPIPFGLPRGERKSLKRSAKGTFPFGPFQNRREARGAVKGASGGAGATRSPKGEHGEEPPLDGTPRRGTSK